LNFKLSADFAIVMPALDEADGCRKLPRIISFY